MTDMPDRDLRLLTPEDAAAIARCSITTVRRAYHNGALTAHRRRGSRAVLLDRQDVLDWALGQVLDPIRATPAPADTLAMRSQNQGTRKTSPRPSRAAKVSGALRFDLSSEALRQRRTTAMESHS
jgi:excisionase family DNA binding protein